METVMKHSTGPIPELPSHIPPSLKRFVYRCMDKDKARRPADAEAFIAELRAAMAKSAEAPVARSAGLSSGEIPKTPVGSKAPNGRLRLAAVIVCMSLLVAAIVGALVLAGDDETKKGLEAEAEKPVAAPVAKEKKARTSLLVFSPQGTARVKVGGEDKGTTPLTLKGKVGKKLVITLEKDGFKAAKTSVRFPKKGERRVEVVLEKKKKKKPKVKPKNKDEGYDDY